MEHASLMRRYYARAKQELYDNDRLDTAAEDEIAKLAEYLRLMDFRRHIQPYMHQKEKIVGTFFMLQANPIRPGPMPTELQKALDQWDELIAIEARKFGYEMPADQP